LSHKIRWWCCPPALPRPAGCFLCFPIRPWPICTCPRFFRPLCLAVGCAHRRARVSRLGVGWWAPREAGVAPLAGGERVAADTLAPPIWSRPALPAQAPPSAADGSAVCWRRVVRRPGFAPPREPARPPSWPRKRVRGWAAASVVYAPSWRRLCDSAGARSTRRGSIVYNKLTNKPTTPPHAIRPIQAMGLDAGIAPNLPAGPTAEEHQARSASTRASTHGPQPADFPQARRGRGLASHRTPREQPVCFPGPDDTDHGVTTTAPGVAHGRRDGGGDQPELAPRAQSLG